MISGNKSFAEAWNFGPNSDGNRPVQEVLYKLQTIWAQLQWKTVDLPQPHETKLLYLNNSKAKTKLDWMPIWSIDKAIMETARWYQAWMDDAKVISKQQLIEFIENSTRKT